MELEETVVTQAAWAMLDDQDLLALIASYAYCYTSCKTIPQEFLEAMDVAWGRGLLDSTL